MPGLFCLPNGQVISQVEICGIVYGIAVFSARNTDAFEYTGICFVVSGCMTNPVFTLEVGL